MTWLEFGVYLGSINGQSIAQKGFINWFSGSRNNLFLGQMANTFTRYTATGIGTSATALVTASAATQTTAIGLTLSNTTISPITVSVYLTASATNYYIVKNATVPAGGSLALFGADGKLVLNTGDVLNVVSSAASSVDAIISVLQIT